MIKRVLTVAILLAAAAFSASAQDIPDGYVMVDSLIFTPVSAVDSTLRGENIYSMMPVGVNIRQSGMIRSGYNKILEANAGDMFQGYRIRIFFDNKQNSRTASEQAEKRFKALHPGVGAYRTFSNPYFKVTVGDYRTRSEALASLERIKAEFPTAFIVREKFKYPSMNGDHSFRVDTLHLLKPKAD